MATYNNLTTKVSGSSYRRANIFDLINKVKYEEKKEKRNSIIYQTQPGRGLKAL